MKRRSWGWPRVLDARAAKHVETFALAGHAAAAGVGDRHHAVDVGKRLQHPRSFGRLGDHPGDGRRAVHRGQDGHIVANAHPTVRAPIAHEGGAPVPCARHWATLAARRSSRPPGFLHMHVSPGRNVTRRSRSPGRTSGRGFGGWRRSPSAARGDGFEGADAFAAHRRAGGHALAGDDDIVVRVQSDYRRRLHVHVRHSCVSIDWHFSLHAPGGISMNSRS